MLPEIPLSLVEVLRSAETVTVLTGAGISAESGIPTFREAQTGLWSKFDPQELATPEAFAANPTLVWDWYAWRRELVAEKAPNDGHRALATMATHVTMLNLVTQNVDSLHQQAGSQDVIELHGNISRVHCSQCGRIAPEWDATERPPTCATCSGLLRPSVVWFGEGLDRSDLNRAAQAAHDCDVIFSIGTAAMVYPAAVLPEIALENGAVFVEVNPNPTPLTRYATYAFQQPAGTFLPRLVASVWSD